MIRKLLLFLLLAVTSFRTMNSTELLSRARGSARDNIVPITLFIGIVTMLYGSYRMNLFSVFTNRFYRDNRSTDEIMDDFEPVNATDVHLGTIPKPDTHNFNSDTGYTRWHPISSEIFRDERDSRNAFDSLPFQD